VILAKESGKKPVYTGVEDFAERTQKRHTYIQQAHYRPYAVWQLHLPMITLALCE